MRQTYTQLIRAITLEQSDGPNDCLQGDANGPMHSFKLPATKQQPAHLITRPLAALIKCTEWTHQKFHLCFSEAGADCGPRLPRLPAARGSRIECAPLGARTVINVSECTRARAGIFEWWAIDTGDILECVTALGLLDRDDLLIANVGVHHNERRRLERGVRSFLRWFGDGAVKKPCVVWAETTPQHYPTRDGTYSGVRRRGTNGSCCTPLEPARLQTEPLFRQRFNQFATPLIRAAGIPIAKTFTALAPRWASHRAGSATSCAQGAADCTHWDRWTYRWLAAATVAAALGACAPRTPSTGGNAHLLVRY